MKLYHIVVGPISTNCYLYADEDNITAIIDPAAEADEIIGVIEKNSLVPKAILLTHAHYDHIGAVAPLCARYPGLRVYLNKADLPLAETYKAGSLPNFLNKKDYDNLEITDFVSEGDEIEVGALTFTVLHTPGHTLGGCCYLCGGALFTGDTLFRREAGRTDLMGGDYPTLLRSLKRLHDLEGDYTVLPGHEGFSKLSEERTHNYYMLQAVK